MPKLKGKLSEGINSVDTWQCSWYSGHRQCQMLGTIAPLGNKFYCTWHYKSLNNARFASDYEQFLMWHTDLINNYPYARCFLTHQDCGQRINFPKCNRDKYDCPPLGSQWHGDPAQIWVKVSGE